MAPGVARKERGLPLENEGGVGGVVNDDEIVLLGESDDGCEELGGGRRAGGIVGIIDHQGFGAAEFVGGDGIQIGQELVLLQQGKIENLAAVILAVSSEDGVSGRGHQGDIAGIDEASREDGQRGLGADGVDDVGVPGRGRKRRRRFSSIGRRLL